MRWFRRNLIGTTIVMVSVLSVCSMLPATASAKAPNEQLVCIDPGHQRYGNNDLEPVAPGSMERKAKVSSGTRGVVTKKYEYVLTLEASQLIKQKLESLGFQVAMTRETHDVDISNAERAQLCNDLQADLSVRIHADGDTSSSTRGISLLYPARSSATEAIVTSSKAAADLILRESVAATGATSRGVVPRSDLTGFNWSTVPSVLVEMGFMTNPQEDTNLSNPEYLDKLTDGIVNGIKLSLANYVQEPEVEETSRAFLPTNTQLYDKVNDRMIRTTLALSPQIVKVSATQGSWGKVNTWQGEKWLYLGQGLTPLQSIDTKVEVRDNTPFYRSPSDSAAVGRLSSQAVHAREQWNSWYLIDTWLGEMWVSP